MSVAMSTNGSTRRKDQKTAPVRTSNGHPSGRYPDSFVKDRDISTLRTQIGLTAEELGRARQTKFWRTWRVVVIAAFWTVWTGMIAGAVAIILLKNGDVTETTTNAMETTTHTLKFLATQ